MKVLNTTKHYKRFMYQLIESIKVLNNRLYNLSYHQRRVQRSVEELYNKKNHCISFNELQKEALNLDNKVLYKLRIEYNESDFKYDFLPYKRREINSLRIIEDDSLDYSLKYSNRDKLLEHFNNKGECDDVLFTINGSIADTYYCNVALKKNGQWFTPDMPLLFGTKRQQLIDELLITPKEIFIEDIPDYSQICLFNALIDFGEIIFNVENIDLG